MTDSLPESSIHWNSNSFHKLMKNQQVTNVTRSQSSFTNILKTQFTNSVSTQFKCFLPFFLIRITQTSSAIAEGLSNLICQLTPCQMLHNCKKLHWKRLATAKIPWPSYISLPLVICNSIVFTLNHFQHITSYTEYVTLKSPSASPSQLKLHAMYTFRFVCKHTVVNTCNISYGMGIRKISNYCCHSIGYLWLPVSLPL